MHACNTAGSYRSCDSYLRCCQVLNVLRKRSSLATQANGKPALTRCSVSFHKTSLFGSLKAARKLRKVNLGPTCAWSVLLSHDPYWCCHCCFCCCDCRATPTVKFATATSDPYFVTHLTDRTILLPGFSIQLWKQNNFTSYYHHALKHNSPNRTATRTWP